MSTSQIDIDVLIVGAGPVGLFLANECARGGLNWRLVETHSSQSLQSKALAIFPRTLEILDMAGLVGPFLEVANRVTSVAVVAHGGTLAHMRFAPTESPYPLIAMVPQNVTEAAARRPAHASWWGRRVRHVVRVSGPTRRPCPRHPGPVRPDALPHDAIRRRLRRRAQHRAASAEPAIRRSGVSLVVHAG